MSDLTEYGATEQDAPLDIEVVYDRGTGRLAIGLGGVEARTVLDFLDAMVKPTHELVDEYGMDPDEAAEMSGVVYTLNGLLREYIRY